MARILYLGDGALGGAARYLAGVMKRLELSFDHIGSYENLPARALETRYDLFILSDYPARNFTRPGLRRLVQRVNAGASLLMIGGWASFRGSEGGYEETPLADLLPVRCARRDDRQQGGPAYRIVRRPDAPWPRGFDFQRAPGVCGYNRTTLKTDALEILQVEALTFERGSRVRVLRRDPLFVVRTQGHHRIGALTTDLAPHWVGGLVDWGARRVTLSAAPGITAEVGATYVRFVAEVLRTVLPGAAPAPGRLTRG